MARTKMPVKEKETKKKPPIKVEISGQRSNDEMAMLDKILDTADSKLPVEGLRRRIKRLLCDEFLCDRSFINIQELLHKMIEDYVPEDDKMIITKKVGECINHSHTNDLKTRKELLEYEWYNKVSK